MSEADGVSMRLRRRASVEAAPPPPPPPGRPSSPDRVGKPNEAARRSGKLKECTVVLLDGSEANFKVDPSARAQTLFDLTCDFLCLAERQYFGLCFKDPTTGMFEWLYNDKRIARQLDGSGATWRVDFAVKFYPLRPEALTDAQTRGCIALQVRQNLVAGRLPCSHIGYAIIGSYLMQSELGDWTETAADAAADIVARCQFCPEATLTNDPELLGKARKLHKGHAGLASRDAERKLLENARKLATYGLDFHEAATAASAGLGRSQAVLVGVCGQGILLMKPDSLLRLARFTWPRVTALTRKGREVSVCLRGAASATSPTTADAAVRLRCGNGKLATRLWRSAVEHHGFFRLKSRDKTVSCRQIIQPGTVRISRSCTTCSSISLAATIDDSAIAAAASKNSLQKRSLSLNRTGELAIRAASLVTPEDSSGDEITASRQSRAHAQLVGPVTRASSTSGARRSYSRLSASTSAISQAHLRLLPKDDRQRDSNEEVAMIHRDAKPRRRRQLRDSENSLIAVVASAAAADPLPADAEMGIETNNGTLEAKKAWDEGRDNETIEQEDQSPNQRQDYSYQEYNPVYQGLEYVDDLQDPKDDANYQPDPVYQGHNEHYVQDPRYQRHDSQYEQVPEYQGHNGQYEQDPRYQHSDTRYEQDPEYQGRDSEYEQDPEYQGRDSKYEQDPEYQGDDSKYEQDSEYQGGDVLCEQNHQYPRHKSDYEQDPRYQGHKSDYEQDPRYQGHNSQNEQDRQHPCEQDPSYQTHVQYEQGIQHNGGISQYENSAKCPKQELENKEKDARPRVLDSHDPYLQSSEVNVVQQNQQNCGQESQGDQQPTDAAARDEKKHKRYHSRRQARQHDTDVETSERPRKEKKKKHDAQLDKDVGEQEPRKKENKKKDSSHRDKDKDSGDHALQKREKKKKHKGHKDKDKDLGDQEIQGKVKEKKQKSHKDKDKDLEDQEPQGKEKKRKKKKRQRDSSVDQLNTQDQPDDPTVNNRNAQNPPQDSHYQSQEPKRLYQDSYNQHQEPEYQNRTSKYRQTQSKHYCQDRNYHQDREYRHQDNRNQHQNDYLNGDSEHENQNSEYQRENSEHQRENSEYQSVSSESQRENSEYQHVSSEYPHQDSGYQHQDSENQHEDSEHQYKTFSNRQPDSEDVNGVENCQSDKLHTECQQSSPRDQHKSSSRGSYIDHQEDRLDIEKKGEHIQNGTHDHKTKRRTHNHHHHHHSEKQDTTGLLEVQQAQLDHAHHRKRSRSPRCYRQDCLLGRNHQEADSQQCDSLDQRPKSACSDQDCSNGQHLQSDLEGTNHNQVPREPKQNNVDQPQVVERQLVGPSPLPPPPPQPLELLPITPLGSPVRHPPSGEETPADICDAGDGRTEAGFFRSPKFAIDATTVEPARVRLVARQPSTDSQLLTLLDAMKNSPTAASAMDTTVAVKKRSNGTAKEEPSNRVSVLETMTETTEITAPIEELISCTDQHGNTIVRRVLRCRKIRRIVTDTVVEAPLVMVSAEDAAATAAADTDLQSAEQQQRQPQQQKSDEGYV